MIDPRYRLLLLRNVASLLLLVGLAASPARADVSGTLRYENLLFPERGTGDLQDSEWRPIRQATVELVGATDSLVLGSTISDESGNYTIDINPAAGARAVYLRVLAEQDNARVEVEIVDRSGRDYSMVSEILALDLAEDHTIDVDGTWADGNGGLFNIFDVILQGGDFTRALAGVPPPGVRVVWYPGANGTFFRPNTREIQLTSIDGVDTDEYDDDIILHEYGHAVANAFSYDDSPGGFHRITRRHDIRLTWSEGFATFYSCLVRGEPGYVDTASLFSPENSIRLMYEIETPGFAEFATGSNNELAVSATLWDLVDGGPGDDDFIDRTPEEFWAVFADYFDPDLEAQVGDFYDGWEALALPDFYQVNQVFLDFQMEFAQQVGDHPFATPYNLFAVIPVTGSTEIALNVEDPITIQDLRCYVSTDIPPSASSALELSLISPAGTEVLLREANYSGPTIQVRQAWYGPETFGAPAESLESFAGEDSQGTWRLKVRNTAFSNLGNVRRWGLVVSGSREGSDPADFNEDGLSDVHDLFLFSRVWRDLTENAGFLSRKSDLDGDGAVDEADLIELLPALKD